MEVPIRFSNTGPLHVDLQPRLLAVVLDCKAGDHMRQKRSKSNFGETCLRADVSYSACKGPFSACNKGNRKRLHAGNRETGNKNIQLALQHCCKTRWKAMLDVLPPTFKPVNNLIWFKTRLVPSRYLSVFLGGERRLGLRLRRARGLMGRGEGKIAPQTNPQSSLIPKNI